MRRIELNPYVRLRRVPYHDTYLVRADGLIVRIPELDPKTDLKPATGEAADTYVLRKITRKAPLRVFDVAVSKGRTVQLNVGGKLIPYRAADVVASAWLDPAPSPAHFITYVDGDHTNLDPSNLRWTEAAAVKGSLEAIHPNPGAKGGRPATSNSGPKPTLSRQIDPRQVYHTLDLAHVLALYAAGTKQNDIARKLGVTRKVINNTILRAKAKGMLKVVVVSMGGEENPDREIL